MNLAAQRGFIEIIQFDHAQIGVVLRGGRQPERDQRSVGRHQPIELVNDRQIGVFARDEIIDHTHTPRAQTDQTEADRNSGGPLPAPIASLHPIET